MTEKALLPLFPLNTVLFPEGVLGLQIFEVRYLKMIRQCVDEGLPFGVVTLETGGEITRPNEEIALAGIGCLAEVTHFTEETPTLFKVLAKGTQRFKLLEVEQNNYGLWLGDVEHLPADPEVKIPSEIERSADLLNEVIESLSNQLSPDETLPIAEPFKLNDCAWVSNRWCELLPLDKPTKLRLLALDNPLIRLELITDELDKASSA